MCAINNCNYHRNQYYPCNQTCNQCPQSKTQSKQSHNDQQSRQSLQSTSIAYCTISWYMQSAIGHPSYYTWIKVKAIPVLYNWNLVNGWQQTHDINNTQTRYKPMKHMYTWWCRWFNPGADEVWLTLVCFQLNTNLPLWVHQTTTPVMWTHHRNAALAYSDTSYFVSCMCKCTSSRLF